MAKFANKIRIYLQFLLQQYTIQYLCKNTNDLAHILKEEAGILKLQIVLDYEIVTMNLSSLQERYIC